MALITRRQFAAGLAGISAGVAVCGPRVAWADSPPFRFAVSMETLAGANVIDARAAYRVWVGTLAKAVGMQHMALDPEIFLPSARILAAIRAGQLDGFVLSAWEFVSVADLLEPNHSILEDSVVNGVEYLLLVSESSSVKSIEDLHGARLLLHRHRTSTLLRAWIGILLGGADLDSFFGAAETHDQAAEVILPVFFGKAQAAALSRRSFEMAVELNPQIGRALKSIAVSPSVIPEGLWFRKGCDVEDRSNFVNSVMRMHEFPEGRQVMTIYQTAGFCERPCSVMEATVKLIRKYEHIRLRGAVGSRDSK